MGRPRAKGRKRSPEEMHETVRLNPDDADGLLSPELRAELGGDSCAGGTLAVAAKLKKGRKRGRGEKASPETRQLAATISKSRAKKLKQLEHKKAKDSRRSDLYRKLEENKLSQGHLSLLQSSKAISQSQDTLKSRIRLAVQRAMAGIELEDSTVAELEAHPEAVGDVEEALCLPVGGALAAAKRARQQSEDPVPPTQAAATASAGRGTGGRKRKPKREGNVLSETRGKVEPARTRKAKVEAGSVTGESLPKHATSKASAHPKQAEIVSARGNGNVSSSSSSSGSSGSSSSESKCDDDAESDAPCRKSKNDVAMAMSGSSGAPPCESPTEDAQMPHATEPTVHPAARNNAISAKGCGIADRSGAGAAMAIPSESAAKSSGSSWAAKMMASLARVPTGSSKGSAAASLSEEAAPSGQGGTGAEGDAQGDAVEDSLAASTSAANTADTADASVAVSSASSASAAVASCPPAPSWVEGKAPAYHAVETPLPLASRDASPFAEAKAARLPRPKRWVPVERSAELQVTRMQLPVCGMEQEIVEAIHDNDAVILCGETGSGKSTQVPQFLYEAGYAAHGLIGVTQPRRVAAIGTAERVAAELGTRCGKAGTVAYQIRYDSSGVGPKTLVKFMTDGVLLREITSDLLLRDYSVVLLDEAHERNLNTDVLLGMLSRSIPLRKQVAAEEQRAWQMLCKERQEESKPPLRPLKLVIMSATLRVTDFTENKALFPRPPPVLSATSRQHPVTIHFSKRTELYDYVGETFKKVCKIHQRLPAGGVLVFLTGKSEIVHMCQKLRREFPPPRRARDVRRQPGGGKDDERRGNDGAVDGAVKEERRKPQDKDGVEGEGSGKAREGAGDCVTRLDTPHPQDKSREALLYREADDDEEDAARLAEMDADSGSDLVQDRGGSDGEGEEISTASISRDSAAEGRGRDADGTVPGGIGGRDEAFDEDALPPVYVVPLYAMLTADEQAKVFQSPPEGHRLIVVATNVAETSITIPGISYVVDCGRQKRRIVQRGSGISQFEVGWVSKASADQRAGRAGRTGPGHCYRLYSSALYSQTLESFAPPEVLTRPLEDVMLQMKAMGITDVSRFPFPTPPDAAGLRAATNLLANLGAITSSGGGPEDGRRDGTGEITPLGKALALLPVGARYAKMLLLAVQGGLVAHATALVAALTEGDPFVRPDAAAAAAAAAPSADELDGDETVGQQVVQDDDAHEEARRVRAQWSHPNSDALARLKAVGAYAHTTSGGTQAGGGDFCRKNFLHAPTMERSLQLRRQLARLLELRFGGEPGWNNCDMSASLRPPNRRQSDALRQLLLSGLLDNVARKAPAGTVKAGSKLQRDCAYLSCDEAIVEPLYIKSSSVVFSRDPKALPEWVVYQGIVRGDREGAPARMTCVTAIEPSWLPALAEGSPMLSFSSPLASPSPIYDEAMKTVSCMVRPKYGVHAWELPPHPMELATAAPANKPDMVFRWFGRLLLQGGVAGCLGELKEQDMLNDPPFLVTRETPTKKVSILVLELRQKGVCSLPTLAHQWLRNPTYLKSSVAMWVKLGRQKQFDEAWNRARVRARRCLEKERK